MNYIKELLAQNHITVEYNENIDRLERIKALPLSAFQYNPVYRIMLIWEAEQYIKNVFNQLDTAFLN